MKTALPVAQAFTTYACARKFNAPLSLSRSSHTLTLSLSLSQALLHSIYFSHRHLRHHTQFLPLTHILSLSFSLCLPYSLSLFSMPYFPTHNCFHCKKKNRRTKQNSSACRQVEMKNNIDDNHVSIVKVWIYQKKKI